MYCGDGINDLAALASAEAGMAVGAGHASAAACLADSHPSIQGMRCNSMPCHTYQELISFSFTNQIYGEAGGVRHYLGKGSMLEYAAYWI